MALQLNDATAIINRTTGLVAASSNYTACFWYQPAFVSTSPDYITQLAITDAGYTAWAGIFGDASQSDGSTQVNVSDGGAPQSSADAVIAANAVAHLAYVRNGTTHEFYVNGVLIGSATLDLSAITFAELLLGNDNFSVVTSALRFEQFREWDAVLTATEIQTEMFADAAVRTANLQTDTPLSTDLLDDSGNGHDWSGAGSFSFVDDLVKNASAATAQPLTVTFSPQTLIQTAHANGVTSTVWFRFTAPAGMDVVHAFARNQTFGGTYDPYTIVHIGPDASSITPYLGIENDRAPVQIPVHESDTYWLEIQFSAGGNPSPAVLELTYYAFTQQSIPVGGLIVPDDTTGFPWAILSRDDGLPTTFIMDYPAGESAYLLDDGYILAEDIAVGVALFGPAPTFTPITTLPWNPTGVHAGFISGRGEHFYVGNPTSASNASMPANSVRLINKDGTFGPTTWTPTTYTTAGTGTDGGAIAVSPDESVLYWHTRTPTTPTLKRWDLVNDVALPDLATGPVGWNQTRQILCLDDGTILVVYISSPNFWVYRYDPDTGAVLNIYGPYTSILADLGDNQVQIDPTDDPTSFWVWQKLTDGGSKDRGLSRFFRVQTSDGTVLETTPDVPQYEIGAYRPTATATPLADFGHSESCPFLVFGITVPPVVCPGLLGDPRQDGIASPYPADLCPGGDGILGAPLTGV